MDTGADSNVMSLDIAEMTGLEIQFYEGPEAPSFTVGSGAGASPMGTVHLTYTAGTAAKQYTQSFEVLEGLPHDVILGAPFLVQAHAITINPDFAHPPSHPDFLLLELGPKDKSEHLPSPPLATAMFRA